MHHTRDRPDRRDAPARMRCQHVGIRWLCHGTSSRSSCRCSCWTPMPRCARGVPGALPAMKDKPWPSILAHSRYGVHFREELRHEAGGTVAMFEQL